MRRFLPLLLDAPLQSWGYASRFQRRTTGLYPTKSGVIGLIAAAMGLAKGSVEEPESLRDLARLGMTVIVLPRPRPGITEPTPERRGHWLEPRRLEDYHTVGGGFDPKTQPQWMPRKASGGACDHPTVSHRQYLLDARFGVLLSGERETLERVASALRDPVWGVWFGRKCCIPAAPLLVADANRNNLFAERSEAFATLLRAEAALRGVEPRDPLPDESDFHRIMEEEPFTDSFNDQPVSFGDGTSSGPDKRQFAMRRVRVLPPRKTSPTG